MSVAEEIINRLINAGTSPAEAANLVALLGVELISQSSQKSTGALRQQRYRERIKRNESVTKRNAVTPAESVTKRNESVTNRNDVTGDIYTLSSIESKKDKSPKRKKRNALPSDFQLTEKMLAYAGRKGWQRPKIDFQFRKFCNFHQARGSLMADWEAAWRTWVDNDYDGQKGPQGQTGFQWNGGIEGVI